MMSVLSPIVSEFETDDQAASYERWFRAKVSSSLADTRPRVPHAEAMAGVRAKLAKLQEEDGKPTPSDRRDT